MSAPSHSSPLLEESDRYMRILRGSDDEGGEMDFSPSLELQKLCQTKEKRRRVPLIWPRAAARLSLWEKFKYVYRGGYRSTRKKPAAVGQRAREGVILLVKRAKRQPGKFRLSRQSSPQRFEIGRHGTDPEQGATITINKTLPPSVAVKRITLSSLSHPTF